MTDANRSATEARTTLGFGVQGLSSREETLFKAFVMLLDHRTTQHWTHQPERPDVQVVAEGTPPRSLATHAGTGAPLPILTLLRLDSPQRERPCFLRLPLRTTELEAELNQLGAFVLQRHATTAATESLGHPAVARLLRWPPPHLLPTPAHLRLATILASRPMPLAQVQQRSNLPEATCLAFFSDLRQAGVLVTEPSIAPCRAPAPPVPTAALAPPSLLGRIRLRLGLPTFHRA